MRARSMQMLCAAKWKLGLRALLKQRKYKEKIQRNVQKSVMHLQSCCFANIGASSLEPGFRDLAFTSKSSVKFSMRSYDRAGWLGSRDLGKRV